MSDAIHYIKTAIILLALGIVALTVSSCQKEEMETTAPSIGKIELTMSSEPEVYIETRSTGTYLDDISSLDFTLSGQTTDGEAIANQPLSFKSDGTDAQGHQRFAAIFEAGTYTLTATTKTTVSAPVNAPGAPAYHGTSTQFTIEQGGTATTSIDLGTPINAKITVALDNTFTSKYELPRITITDGTRSVTITDAATAAASTASQPTYGLPTVTYFDVPASGPLSYSITADAKSDSHVTDITSASGSISIEAGKHHILTLTANPVTGEIVPIIEGTYSGTFD